MATAPPAASTDAAPAPGGKKSRKKLIIIVGVVVVLLLSLAGGGALLYMKKKKAADEAEQGSEPESAEVKVAKRDPKVKPAFAALEPFTVNLADRDADRYAQIHLSLELREEKAAELIKSYMPVIRNNVLMVLSHKTSAELLEKDGKLKLIEITPAGVKTPRGMNIDPSGNWLLVAGQDDNVIKSFRINTKTGKLTPSGFSLAVSKPVDIAF
jgi:flagellar FliL protein